MKASQQAIERGVKDCLFVDYKRRSGHFDVTTVASIKEITEKVTVALEGELGACLSLGLGVPVPLGLCSARLTGLPPLLLCASTL